MNISSGGTESTLAFYRTASRRGFEVPCVPLQLILSHLGTFRFDVFSLDVEGYELEVLKTLDLSQTSAQLMIIEAKNRQCGGTCPKRDAVRTLLATAGYTRVEGFRSGFLGKNDVFTPDVSRSACIIKERINPTDVLQHHLLPVPIWGGCKPKPLYVVS